MALAQNESAFLDIPFELLCELLADDRLYAEWELEVFNVALQVHPCIVSVFNIVT